MKQNIKITEDLIEKTDKVLDNMKNSQGSDPSAIRKKDIKQLTTLANVIDRNKHYMTTVTAAQTMIDKQDILEAVLLPTDKQKLKKDVKSFIRLGLSIINNLEKLESAIVDHKSNVERDGLYQQMVDQTTVIETIMNSSYDIPEHCFQSLENDIKAVFDKYKVYK